MKRLLTLLLSLLLPCVTASADQVNLHAWGIEFVSDNGIERECFVLDPIKFDEAIESDPITIDDCLATAQIACPYGIKRFYYRAGDPPICEFECFPGTGGGGS